MQKFKYLDFLTEQKFLNHNLKLEEPYLKLVMTK